MEEVICRSSYKNEFARASPANKLVDIQDLLLPCLSYDEYSMAPLGGYIVGTFYFYF